jgi:hypothetical protein
LFGFFPVRERAATPKRVKRFMVVIKTTVQCVIHSHFHP